MGIRHGVSLRRALSLSVCLTVLACTASSLDFNDVKSLLENRVAEQIVINMVQQSSPIVMTVEQENELRAMGGSESLIAAVKNTGPVTYVTEDGNTYSVGQGTPATAPYVQSSPAPSAPTVVYQQTEPSVTYVDPNVYYQPSSPVIVTSPQPTVVYESPTYVEVPTYVYPGYPRYRSGSSWSFSIGVGNGGRHRPRHWGGRPGRPHRW